MRASVGAGPRGVVRSRSVVWVVAVILAVTIGAGSAFAQEPVVPATTASGQSDGQSKADDGEAKPKAEKPKVDASDVAPPPVTNTDAEAPELAKAGKPKDDKAKPEKAKPAPATAQPETPKQDQPKPAKTPKQEQPKPTPKPKLTQPKGADAAAPSARAAEPAPESQADAATRVSPRPRAAQRVPASSIGHGTTRERPAPTHRVARRTQEAGRPGGAAGPERSATEPAGSVRDSAEAAPATGHAVPQTSVLAARAASDDVAAASAPLDRGPPRVLIVDARQPGNAMLLLAIVLTAAVAFLLGRSGRRRPAGIPRSRRMPRLPASGDR
jgi:hypothetical protein